jgi:hypothetical protein
MVFIAFQRQVYYNTVYSLITIDFAMASSSKINSRLFKDVEYVNHSNTIKRFLVLSKIV